MTDLDKLIAAVEAGGWPDRKTEVAAFYSGGSIAHCNECAGLARQSNAGSLDAALRLHEAMLPGWGWKRVIHPGPVASVGVYEPPKFVMGQTAREVDGNTARAWLLAILRALAAHEQGRGKGA